MSRPRPPSPQPAPHEPDLAELEDEQLVGLAQAYGYRPAWDELMARCGELKERLLNRHLARCGWQDADRRDTQQQAVLWIVEAIKRYHPGQVGKGRCCRFRTFLYRVLRARFIDSLRHRRHLRRVRLVGVAWVWRQGAETVGPGRPVTPVHGGTSPQQAAEQSEQRARLRQELDRLDEPARRLWELLARGTRLREIAAALGMSYDAVKRRRRELLAHLKVRLNREDPS